MRKKVIGITKLVVKPYANHYRIVIKGTTEPTRPVLYSGDLPLDVMEEICRIMEDRYHQVYKEGWANGYSQGWDDGVVAEPNK